MCLYYEGHSVRYVNGYPAICIGRKTTVYLHTLEMEKYLGRQLSDEEVVHHIDEDRMNFKIDNLWCFRSKADHAAYHRGVKAVKDNNGIYYCPDMCNHREQNFCKVCGAVINDFSVYCIRCVGRINGLNSRRVKRPSRDEFKKLIRTDSFESIGRVYGVSGNSIKKWCDSFGLPRNKSVIKQYSDSEWDLL